ncbi:hypothetical protein KCP75_23565 [Salmonella enterica subsp. enterica]|nr:hypothetical protein KCP75_23565 [Salmonella enterica subsp. enterica]
MLKPGLAGSAQFCCTALNASAGLAKPVRGGESALARRPSDYRCGTRYTDFTTSLKVDLPESRRALLKYQR